MPDSTGVTDDPALARVNGLAAEDFRTEFAQCLDIARWVDELERARPFPDRHALVTAADNGAASITDEEVTGALARHPRIGERADGADTESSWSRGEQSGVSGATRDGFSAANAAYEERFGHIYLVCASGRGGDELLADLDARLGNDPATETRVVAGELRKIALLRVDKLLGP